MNSVTLTPQQSAALLPEAEAGRRHAVKAQYHDLKAKESHDRLGRMMAAMFGRGATLDVQNACVTLPEEATDGA